MSYLVLECHHGYAIVLDEQGRFLRAANLHYEVGQTVDEVVLQKAPAKKKRKFAAILSAAACLCLVLLGSWQFIAAPIGTVRMQINPDVLLTVNRLNYVVAAEGLNEDGRLLVDGVSTFGKKVDKLSDELADRAVAMGYLQDGGQVTLTVESENQEWLVATEELLVLELEIHLEHRVEITIAAPPSGQTPPAPTPEITPWPGPTSTPEVTSAPTTTPQPTVPVAPSDGDDDWDDRYDDDWDDDDDDDWDDDDDDDWDD